MASFAWRIPVVWVQYSLHSIPFILAELTVLNIVFLTVLLMNGIGDGLPNHIIESNSIETFKKNVGSFIKDN